MPGVAAQSTDRVRDLLALIAGRHSVRRFTTDPVPRAAVESMVAGVAPATGRALPSAHALDPLRFRVVAHRVDGLEPGEYEVSGGRLDHLGPAPTGAALLDCCLDRPAWSEAAAVIAVTAVDDPVEHFRGQDDDDRRGERFIHLEAGHAAQNLQLLATALGLGTVFIGGIVDERVRAVLSLPAQVRPLGLLPVGLPAE